MDERTAFLLQADADGRLVVLPCPMGATVYLVMGRKAKHQGYVRFVKTTRLTWYNAERVIREFGKTVFLTMPEAVAAKEALDDE